MVGDSGAKRGPDSTKNRRAKMKNPVPQRRGTGFSRREVEGSELALEILAGGELHAFRGLDLDAFAGLRVHAHAGLAVDHFESPEADELHDPAFFEVRLEAFDDGIDGAFRIGLGAPEFLLDEFREFYFVHGLLVRFVRGGCSGGKKAQFFTERIGGVNGPLRRRPENYRGGNSLTQASAAGPLEA